MLVDIRVDSEKLTQEQIVLVNSVISFAVSVNKIESAPVYSNHIRDMTTGWQKISNVKDYKEAIGPFVPGTYAIVYDPAGKIDNPITWNQTLSFGESTQPAHKRIYSHAGALKGRITNMTEKWNKTIPILNKIIGADIRENLQHLSIFFRPHNLTDPEFQYNRDHSCYMEKQAHAYYHALWGHGTKFNTRDLPSIYLIQNAKKILSEKGFTCKYEQGCRR
jgi:hypothetical protein